jgi:hypothetical protein
VETIGTQVPDTHIWVTPQLVAVQPHMLVMQAGVVPEHALLHEAQCISLRSTHPGPSAPPVGQHNPGQGKFVVVSQRAHVPPVTHWVPAVLIMHCVL